MTAFYLYAISKAIGFSLGVPTEIENEKIAYLVYLTYSSNSAYQSAYVYLGDVAIPTTYSQKAADTASSLRA